MKKRPYRSLVLCIAVLAALASLAVTCVAPPPAWAFTVDPPVLPQDTNAPPGPAVSGTTAAPGESPSVTINRTVNTGGPGGEASQAPVVIPTMGATIEPSSSPSAAPAPPARPRGSFVLVVGVLVVAGLLAGLYFMNRSES